MPKTSELSESPRKEMHVFYVLDTSGSMTGTKISMLNKAMEESIDALSDLAKSNADAKLKVAVLEFNTGCKWVTSNGPESLEEDFVWDGLSAGGLTDIGSALTELNSKLSRHAFLSSMTGALMPVIIFMTDGQATDNYQKALDAIRNNRWFRRAVKIGFAIGEDYEVDLSMISSIVGNSEAVIKTSDLELFRRLIKFVSVTSSMLVSQSSLTNKPTTGEDIIKEAKKNGEITDEETINKKIVYDPEPEPIAEGDADGGPWDDDEDW